jgi:hypothetical protein
VLIAARTPTAKAALISEPDASVIDGALVSRSAGGEAGVLPSMTEGFADGAVAGVGSCGAGCACRIGDGEVAAASV